jgi:hypothetical protein
MTTIRRLPISVVFAALTFAPAMAQAPCLTLSEGLRCVNESNYPSVSEVMRTSGGTPVPYSAARVAPANCLGSRSVFLRGGDLATCE